MCVHTRCRVLCVVASVLLVMPFTLVGCSGGYREDLDYEYKVKQEWQVEEFSDKLIVQFESVFWEPDDSISLRQLIVNDGICSGRDVLEIGTGTGLISIVCALNGANRVVATEINPAAVANAKYNAAMLAEGMPVEVRAVPKNMPGAFSVIKPIEKFHLIISNPPWEDGQISKPADHAFYDPSFKLMDTLLDGLPNHLHPGGRCLLAYGHVPAIERLLRESKRRGYAIKVLDDRKLDQLPKDFLPGMMVEIRLASGLQQNSPTVNVDSLSQESGNDNSVVDSTTKKDLGGESTPNVEPK